MMLQRTLTLHTKLPALCPGMLPGRTLCPAGMKRCSTTGFVDIKLEYTLHKAAAGDSPGRYRITDCQITIAEDWKSDLGRTPWSAESRRRLTVDDGRRLSHDLRSVTMTSGKRPAQHCVDLSYNHTTP